MTTTTLPSLVPATARGHIGTLQATLAAVVLGGSALMAAAPVQAQSYVNVQFGAPPPMRAEVIPAPVRGQTWIPGHWDMRGNQYVWREGHWERARAGYYYQPTTWVQRGNQWQQVQGRWSPGDQDGDGVRNRNDRDRDGDGVRNRNDRDRDGDGVRNRDDRFPDNPRRN